MRAVGTALLSLLGLGAGQPAAAMGQRLVVPEHSQSEGLSLEGEPDGFGLGMVVGEPTGLSVAWRTQERSLWQGTVAWRIEEQLVRLGVDYLFNLTFFASDDTPSIRYPLYVGLGGVARFGRAPAGGTIAQAQGDSTTSPFGVRLPIGLTVLPSEHRVDAFVEACPVLGLYPNTQISWEWAIGARFYF